MAKESDRLEQEMSVGMPSWDEMRHPSKNPGAVRKHMTWNSRNFDKIERYRRIQMILNPGEEKSVENLRKDR